MGRIDFQSVAQQALANSEALIEQYLPGGRWMGREYRCGDITGGPGDSFSINRDTHRWADFATEAKGGDFIALVAAQRGVSQLEAARLISGEDVYVNGHSFEPPPRVEIHAETPPEDVKLDARQFKHVRHGLPNAVYVYRTEAGAPLSVVARYETAEGKTFAPWVWVAGAWKAKAYPKPRPLYGLQRLSTHTRRIVVVEGEKAADTLQAIATRSPVITWSGGANNWKNADWGPLAGRQVLLWPDADPPGVSAMAGVAGLLLAQGCEVWRVDIEGLPDSWDAHDVIMDGATDSAALNAWLKPRSMRIKPPEPEGSPYEPPPEPERVADPEPVPERAIVEYEESQAPSEEPQIEPEGEAGGLPKGYNVQNWGITYSRSGPHINMATAGKLVKGMVERHMIEPIWLDSFRGQVMQGGQEWTDSKTLELLNFIQSSGTFHKVSRQQLDDGINHYAAQHARNPAREWLLSLQWDGKERLAELLSTGFGADQSRYARQVGRCFLMGMVARILMPGCKVDNLPVFEGPQGARKSQALAIIGGQWHAEVTENVTSKDFYLCLKGKMVIEIPEFKSFRGVDADALKAAISRANDTYRAPYERRAADHPRQCVFAATINRKEWINDPTGARRFWPVRCGAINLQWLTDNREQIFAEAVSLVRMSPDNATALMRTTEGSAWWDVDDELAREQQEHRQRDDSLAPRIKEWCAHHARNGFTVLDVASGPLGLKESHALDERLAERIKGQLTRWGYEAADDEHGVRVWKLPEEA